MKKYSVLILTMAISFALFSQKKSCPKPAKKAVKLFNKAQIASSNNRKTLLYKALSIDPNYIEAIEGLANLAKRKENTAMTPAELINAGNTKRKYWQKMIDICPTYRNYYYTLLIGDYYFNKKKFETSKPYFEKILTAPNALKKDVRYAHDRVKDIKTYISLVNQRVPFSPIKLEGPSTHYDEYLPMLSPDNSYLYFTRKIPDETKGAADKGFSEQFIRSKKNRKKI